MITIAVVEDMPLLLSSSCKVQIVDINISLSVPWDHCVKPTKFTTE
jgi:hypothetical protein